MFGRKKKTNPFAGDAGVSITYEKRPGYCWIATATFEDPDDPFNLLSVSSKPCELKMSATKDAKKKMKKRLFPEPPKEPKAIKPKAIKPKWIPLDKL